MKDDNLQKYELQPLECIKNQKKSKHMNKIFLLFLVVIVFASCRTNQLSISVLSPSPVTISTEVSRVGVVNRSIPADEKKAVNALHQLLSAESISMLKEGSAESIRGLKDALLENEQFNYVSILDTINLRSDAIGVFSAPLSWEQVEKICLQNNVQVLFVLEMFHTELKINPVAVTNIVTSLKNPLQAVNALQQVSINTQVQMGWRIYDPLIKRILDDFTLVKDMNFNSNGNPLVAVDRLLQRKEYVKQTANFGGRVYSDRIVQHWYRVYRDYFVRAGNANFKIAKRRAIVGNWDGAAELWQNEVNNPKQKTAGRACFNMAIINEINGNIDDAIRWAQKSYEDYNVRLAHEYVRILKQRKIQENLVNIQQTQ